MLAFRCGQKQTPPRYARQAKEPLKMPTYYDVLYAEKGMPHDEGWYIDADDYPLIGPFGCELTAYDEARQRGFIFVDDKEPTQ